MDHYLNYKDIYLIPKYSEVLSRSNVDISVEFLGRKWDSPIIPSNMSSVIDIKIAKWLSENNYFYIFHRFGKFHDCPRNFTRLANKENWKTISISIGVNDTDRDIIEGSIWEKNRIDFITIDVAMGHHILVKEMIQFIKNSYKESSLECPKIIAGNVCTPSAVYDLSCWGADACKVGIAGGFVCSTKNQTGFHVPMFSCVEDCANGLDQGLGMHIDCPIIADGSIRENGDIAKALVAGATMVQCGSILAACKDSPGEETYKFHLDHYIPYPSYDGPFNPRFKETRYKKYYGSASKLNKQNTNQPIHNIEGIESEIECNKMTFSEKYQEIKESLQSSCSYAGSNNLHGLKNVKWVITK
jgi:GMP reductase